MFKSVDGAVGQLIRDARKHDNNGAPVVEIDAQPLGDAIRKDNLKLPGPWRLRFESQDGSLPKRYTGYYYKQPSNKFGGCNDSEALSVHAYQKKFFPRAVYVQIAGVAPQSYLYSLNDKDLDKSHCADNPNYRDPLNRTEHPGCAKALGAGANRAFCRLRHVRDSFLWDSKPTQEERDRLDIFKQCPVSCGYQECIGRKFWVLADSMCGHKDSVTKQWRTFYLNPVIAGANPSTPIRRRGSKGTDVVEKLTDSWLKCGPAPGDPYKLACNVTRAHTVAENRSFFVRGSAKVPNTFGMRTQTQQNCTRMTQVQYEAAHGQAPFDGNALRGFARLVPTTPTSTNTGANTGTNTGSPATRRSKRYFDLCGIFGSLVVDSAAPKVRFRVNLGPAKMQCSGLDSVVCAHPRLQDLPQSFAGIFAGAPEIVKTLKRKVVSSVSHGLGKNVAALSTVLKKADGAVRLVLPLGGGAAREVLWDQRLSSGKSESVRESSATCNCDLPSPPLT